MSLPSVSPFGGWRNRQTARYDLIPGEALEAVAEAFAEGEEKYGRLADDPYYPNWVGLDLSSDHSPLSHALNHLAAVQAGSENWNCGSFVAQEDHLASAAANILMMLWFRDSPRSGVEGLEWPDVIKYYYKRRQEQDSPVEGEPTPPNSDWDDYWIARDLEDPQPKPEPNIFERILSKVTS